MKDIRGTIIYLIDCIIPKSKTQFLFSSFPDVSDNSYAMFKYLVKKEENTKFIWLISEKLKITQVTQDLKENSDFKKIDLNNIKFIKKNSLRGLYAYFRSKYVFFTHGLYPRVKFSSNHILINLWHGMPLKTIGYLDDPDNKDIPKSSFVIATSSFFQQYMAKAFGMKESSVLVAGQPRNDLLFEKNNCLFKFGIKKDEYTKVFLWTPTYRQSTIGYVKIDGDVQNGLPIVSEAYGELNAYLNILNAYMIVKLHPMDILNLKEFGKFTNLVFITNSDLEKHSCQLNQILSEIDILLTDFSSIYIDFLLLNQPIAFVMDDFDSFDNSRGFISNSPKELMPGEFIVSKNELFSFLKNSVAGTDKFKRKREEINELFNEIKTNFSEKLWNKILEREK